MRKSPFWTVALTASVILLAMGCRSPDQPERPEQPEPPVAEAEPEAPVELAAVDVEIPPGGDASMESVSGQSDPACVGKLEPATAETIELPGWKVEVNGYRATLARDGDTEKPLVLGVIADIKEDTGENMLNIGRFIDWWRSKNVEAVVVAGDAGETETGLARAVAALAEPGWPVLVIIGNREAREVYREAMTAVKKNHRNVLDLTQRRLVTLPGATLVSLPGYHDPRFLHAETGCQYFVEDVEPLVPLAKEADGPVFLVAHSGPRGASPRAIDYAREAGNVGDANINRLIAAAEIPFGIFAHIHEAGGKATDVLGHDLVPQGELVDSFFLNVGPADSVRWLMNDETESHGMAGVVRVENGKAAYSIHRLKPLTEEQVAAARQLAPGAE